MKGSSPQRYKVPNSWEGYSLERSQAAKYSFVNLDLSYQMESLWSTPYFK